jgi:hypothetical protein
MKTEVCKLKGKGNDFSLVEKVAEKTAVYNALDKKQGLQLRLLSEELVGMLPELLDRYSGEFWIENEGNNFEIHAKVTSAVYNSEERSKVMSISSSGKNVATVGFMGKVRSIVDAMLLSMAETDPMVMPPVMDRYYIDSLSEAMLSTWSLEGYRMEIQQAEETKRKECWDELEKSIVANLADDVIVGIDGREVNIVIKKKF